jgi:hypothetical protein
MTKDEILQKVDEAIRMCSELRVRAPADRSLAKMYQALELIRAEVLDHWPLSKEERAQINIGIYAVRSMEGLYDQLVHKVTRLDHYLKSANS